MNLDDYRPTRVSMVDFVPLGMIPLDRMVLPDGVIDAWAGEADGEPALWLTFDLLDWCEEDANGFAIDEGPIVRMNAARRALLAELRARFGDDGGSR